MKLLGVLLLLVVFSSAIEFPKLARQFKAKAIVSYPDVQAFRATLYYDGPNERQRVEADLQAEMVEIDNLRTKTKYVIDKDNHTCVIGTFPWTIPYEVPEGATFVSHVYYRGVYCELWSDSLQSGGTVSWYIHKNKTQGYDTLLRVDSVGTMETASLEFTTYTSYTPDPDKFDPSKYGCGGSHGDSIECSLHGYVDFNNQCVCKEHFQNPNCSQYDTSITLTQIYGGYVCTQCWNYYFVDMPYSPYYNQLVVKMDHIGTFGDPDLYVKYEGKPTETSYDYADTSTFPFHQIIVHSAQFRPGRYWIGIRGYKAANYTMYAEGNMQCPNDCSGHGTCIRAVCVCAEGYEREDCSLSSPALLPAIPRFATVMHTAWTYFTINVPPMITGNITVTLFDQSYSFNDTDPDLYVRFNEDPTLSNWDYRNTSRIPSTSVFIPQAVLLARSGKWMVGVYGYRGPASIRVTYEIDSDVTCIHGHLEGGVCICDVGWTGAHCTLRVCYPSPNCSNHGFCDATGTCQCYLPWSGRACDELTCVHGFFYSGICYCFQGWHGQICDQRNCDPFDCSGHGTCMNGTCRCFPPYQPPTCRDVRCEANTIFDPLTESCVYLNEEKKKQTK